MRKHSVFIYLKFIEQLIYTVGKLPQGRLNPDIVEVRQ